MVNKEIERFFLRREKMNLVLRRGAEVRFTCPCCGYPTLSENGAYEICIICNWEDDGQEDFNAEEILGGPNGNLSLFKARVTFEGELSKFEKENNRTRIENPDIILDKIGNLLKEFDNLISLGDYAFQKYVSKNTKGSYNHNNLFYILTYISD